MAKNEKRKNPYKLKKNVRVKSLNKKDQTRVRKEFLDYSPEYLKWLEKNHPEEYLYLAQFTDEWLGGAVHKNEDGNVIPGHLHKNKKLAKDVYDRNNRRNNDVLGVTKANNLLTNIEKNINDNDGWYITNPQLTEEHLINKIDVEPEILSWEEYQDLKYNMTEDMIMFYEAYYAEED